MFKEQYYDGFSVNDSKTYGQHFLKISQRVMLSVCVQETFTFKTKSGFGEGGTHGRVTRPNFSVVLIYFCAPVGWTDNSAWPMRNGDESLPQAEDLAHGNGAHPRPWSTAHRCQNWKKPEVFPLNSPHHRDKEAQDQRGQVTGQDHTAGMWLTCDINLGMSSSKSYFPLHISPSC